MAEYEWCDKGRATDFMSWNHRVMRREFHNVGGGGEVEVLLSVHEVYYDENGKVKSWTKSGIDPVGEDEEVLARVLRRMLAALEKPILDYETGHEIPNMNPSSLT